MSMAHDYTLILFLLYLVQFVIMLCALLAYNSTALLRCLLISTFYASILWVITLAVIVIIVNITTNYAFISQICI